jgi:hypothetical protein
MERTRNEESQIKESEAKELLTSGLGFIPFIFYLILSSPLSCYII